jgi:hypothetical protein
LQESRPAKDGEQTTEACRIYKPQPAENIEKFVTELVKNNKIVVFSKTTCPYCAKVKELFRSLNEFFVIVELDQIGMSIFLNFYVKIKQTY